MRIVFFGSPAAALPCLRGLMEAGHEILLVVTQPDKPAGRGRKTTACPVKTFAGERGLPVIQPERIRKDETVLERLREARPDIHVVVAYGRIIPDTILYLPRWNTLNVHFSLLPKCRGASPVQWAVLSGERRTGVTIIELNAGMDEGDILDAEETEIGRDETAGQLEARLSDIGASLLMRALVTIADGSAVRRPQNHDEATYAPKIAKNDGRIEWTTSAEAVERKVRAFQPWPTAFTYIGGTRLVVRKGRVVDRPEPAAFHIPEDRRSSVPAENGFANRNLDESSNRRVSGNLEISVAEQFQQPGPGTILSVTKDGLTVLCGGDTAYLVEVLQPEGRSAMAAHAFALGARIEPGVRFGDSPQTG